MSAVPALRIRLLNDAPIRPDGKFVLYWMIAARRRRYNFALQRAVEHARALGKGIVVLEALRVAYPWASDRLHGFVLDGMSANLEAFVDGKVRYVPYVEPSAGAGSGLLVELARHACVVVTDYLPSFFLPRMVAKAGAKLDVCAEIVDGNGLLPIAAADRDFPTAYVFRRFLQKTLAPHLHELPDDDPLRGPLPRVPDLPRGIASRWPTASTALLARSPAAISALPIDHAVGLVALRGGAVHGAAQLDAFVEHRLARYGEDRNHPDDDASSGLSPWLHFGHVAAHEVFARVVERERWTTSKLSTKANGKRAGWWNMSAASESFLDELVTWRELGHNHCARNPDTYDRYESLPEWARKTLEAHATDPRPTLYTREELEEARTHDPIWNAAQRQLVRDGRMHNYLRMLWGKKILEWSRGPRDALAMLIELNNRWAVDGRNPNSYSGIFWCLGRYDRPWAPQRPIFGSIRYMSSESTKRKLHMKRYLAEYGG